MGGLEGGIVGRGSVMGPLPPYSRLAELARAAVDVKVVDGQVRWPIKF